MTDHAGIFLVDARQVTRHIFQCYQRNIKGIAETDETGGFVRRIAVKHTSHDQRLVGHKAYSATTHAAVTDHNIGSPFFLYFKKLRSIGDSANYITHIVGFRGVNGNYLFNVVFFVGRFGGYHLQTVGTIIPGNIRQQCFNLFKTFLLGSGKEMGVTGNFTVNARTAELFHGNFLTQHRFNHFGAGDKHLGNVFHHKHIVGEGGGVNSSAGAGAENYGYLWDNTTGQRVTEENFTVTGQ